MTAAAERAEVVAAYVIRLKGCDDTTELVMDLSETEATLIERVAALSRETSEFDCQPTMIVNRGSTQ